MNITRPGDRRHTIAIHEITETDDGMGGHTATWAAASGMSKIWAAIKHPRQAVERTDAGKLEQQLIYEFDIRYRSGVSSKNRVYYESTYHNILSVINPGDRNKSLIIVAVRET